MKIEVVLIDDERKAIESLKHNLNQLCPDLIIVGETQNPIEAISMIEKLKPQLVFLDIAMPELSGFDLLAKIPNPNFEIIFVTAFDEYAIEAIRHCAIGYIVKPVDKLELTNSVDRAINNISKKTALEKNLTLVENIGKQNSRNRKIIIPTQDGLEFIKTDEIIRCEGIDGYTKLFFRNRKAILSSNSIGHFFKLLQNQDFYLTHKSHLINMEYVEKYLNEGYILLIDSHKAPVSRSRRTDFLQTIKELS